MFYIILSGITLAILWVVFQGTAKVLDVVKTEKEQKIASDKYYRKLVRQRQIKPHTKHRTN